MSTESDPLLRDVLADSVTDELRARLLEDTLRHAGRRRRLRRMARATAYVSVVAAGALVWWANPGSWRGAGDRKYVTVATQRLPAASIVQTAPLTPDAWVHNTTGVAIVHTRSTELKILDDQQLLAAIPNASLVRIGDGPAELVFR